MGAEWSSQGTASAPRTDDVARPLVLVVEDDVRMRKYLRAVLTEQELRIADVATGGDALAWVQRHDPDLVIVDYELPDTNGVQVTTRLRERTAAPIVLLSTMVEQSHKAAVLDAGANDYLTRPFGTRELLARIRLWLRRTRLAALDPLESSVEVGNLRIDFARRLVFVGDTLVRLTKTQYRLFEVMMRNAGRVLTHEEILAEVWGPEHKRAIQYLRVYMAQLRRKLGDSPARPRYLITEPGIGYRLHAG
jgi:two-component system KDP operon response regulator KdpE